MLLRLYVVGGTPASERALQGVERLRAALEDADLEVVDLRERPDVAEQERIVATPLLMRVSPEPVRRVVGDLSDAERVRWSLGLPEARA
ncbi:MAG TPA: circadian clock KaiB family protein [Solirubrobacteraceae bacterium]|jgi:circadian clock protein KaiB